MIKIFMCFYVLVVFEYNKQKHLINTFHIMSIVVLSVLCAPLLYIGDWKQKLATLRQPTYLTHYPTPIYATDSVALVFAAEPNKSNSFTCTSVTYFFTPSLSV
jgi:hypothetical protein